MTCLLLDTLLGGNQDAEAIARAFWERLQSVGEKVSRDGRQLETPEENLAQLTTMAREFIDKALPIFRTFGICDPATADA